MIVLNKLTPEDIDEKIRLNLNDPNLPGRTLESFREEIYQEYLDFKWMAIRADVQCQCYAEQLAHIDKILNKKEVKDAI